MGLYKWPKLWGQWQRNMWRWVFYSTGWALTGCIADEKFLWFWMTVLKGGLFQKRFFGSHRDPKRNTPKQTPNRPPFLRCFCFLWFGIPESFWGWKWDFLWESLLSGYVGVLLKIVGFDCWYITVDWSETKEKEERHAGASVWFALKELHTALFVN